MVDVIARVNVEARRWMAVLAVDRPALPPALGVGAGADELQPELSGELGEAAPPHGRQDAALVVMLAARAPAAGGTRRLGHGGTRGGPRQLAVVTKPGRQGGLLGHLGADQVQELVPRSPLIEPV